MNAGITIFGDMEYDDADLTVRQVADGILSHAVDERVVRVELPGVAAGSKVLAASMAPLRYWRADGTALERAGLPNSIAPAVGRWVMKEYGAVEGRVMWVQGCRVCVKAMRAWEGGVEMTIEGVR